MANAYRRDDVRTYIFIHVHNPYRWCSVCRNSFVYGSDSSLDEKFTSLSGKSTQIKYPYGIHDYPFP